MTFPARSTSLRKPLSTAQEGRFIRHLDPTLLSLSGSFESRHSPHSQLPTLSSFLDALLPCFSLILAIPASKPSGGLRVAYLLQLTGYLAPAIEGYPLNQDSLDNLFATLERFDRGWAAILEGKEWDSSAGIAKEEVAMDDVEEGINRYEVQTLRNTDLARLRSIIRDLRQVLSSSLDMPELVPLSINPFEQSLGVDVRNRFGPEEEERVVEQTPELSEADTTTDDDAMSIDTLQEDRDHGMDEEEEDDSDSDEEEFEPVEIVSPTSHVPPAYPDSIERDGAWTSPSSDPRDSPATFEIHFSGPPPPTLTDGEITINSGQTPLTGQQRGFDPDEEYPLEEEDEEGNQSGEEDEGRARKEIREKMKTLFARTEAGLKLLEGGEADTAH